MDTTAFTDARLGELVEITEPVEDVAFVPAPLPENFKMDAALWPLLAEAKAELARLDGAGLHLENPGLILQPLKRREALRSSSLEGTHATAEELFLFEVDSSGAKDGIREVHNYAMALDRGVQALTRVPISLRLVQDLHEVLLRGVRGHARQPGEFRRHQVFIGANRRFVPPPPIHLPAALDELEQAMQLRGAADPLVWSYMIHYQFEAIHPFSDGNGRVGRLLLALMIARSCNLHQPWLYMSPWFEERRADYVEGMFRVSTHGDWNDWLAFCLQGTIAQAQDTLGRLAELIKLRRRFRAQLSAGSVRLHSILDRLFDIFPVVVVARLAEELGVSYPTARSDVERLVDLGILATLSERRPKTFYAPKIVTVGMI